MEYRVTLTIQTHMSDCRVESMLKDPLGHPDITFAKLNIQAIRERGLFGFFIVPRAVLKELEDRNMTVIFSSETVDKEQTIPRALR